MITRREIIDYPSNTYINIFASDRCKLYRDGEFVKAFDSYEDAFNYWFNEYCQ